MIIAHYTYDSCMNMWCGGGGGYRELTINLRLGQMGHGIQCYYGNWKGIWKYSYLISRLAYSICATIHSIFNKADVYVFGFSAYAPVFGFLFHRNKSVILFYHELGSTPFKKYGPIGFFPWLAEKIVLHFGKNFITLTDSMADMIQERYRHKATPGYVGYDESLRDLPTEDRGYILYFGRIDVYMKGLDTLLDAFDLMQTDYTYSLRIAGRGSWRDTDWLRERIAESPHHAWIAVMNNATEEEKADLLTNCSLVCLPSRYEGWSIVAMEAAACGKAVLASNIPGLRDAVVHRLTGWLIPPEKPRVWAKSMSMMLKHGELRARLGAAGKKRAEGFTWDRIAHIHETVYDRVHEGE